MSTKTSDRQFLLVSILYAWTLLRIVATVLGVVAWSWWIVVALFCCAWAFVAWGHVEEV